MKNGPEQKPKPIIVHETRNIHYVNNTHEVDNTERRTRNSEVISNKWPCKTSLVNVVVIRTL